MEAIRWVSTNWFEAVQTVGIISSSLFTAYIIRKDSTQRKVENLNALGESHHSIWKQMRESPGLSRIMDERADLATKPLSNEERVFVTSLVAHTYRVYQTSKARMLVKLEKARKDIGALFSLPIPKAVWEKIREYQDTDFVSFVEECLSGREKILRDSSGSMFGK